jgi:hypothetical protein
MSGGGNPNHDEKGRFTDGPSGGGGGGNKFPVPGVKTTITHLPDGSKVIINKPDPGVEMPAGMQRMVHIQKYEPKLDTKIPSHTDGQDHPPAPGGKKQRPAFDDNDETDIRSSAYKKMVKRERLKSEPKPPRAAPWRGL